MRLGDRLVSEEIRDLFRRKPAASSPARQRDAIICGRARSTACCSGRRGDAWSASKAATPSSSAWAARKPSISPAITCRSKWFWPNTVHFITAKDDGEIDYDRPKLVDTDCALLIYMGPGTPGRMAEAPIAAGLPAEALVLASREGQGKLVMKVSKFLSLHGMVVLTAPPDFTLPEAARRFAQTVGGRRFSLAVVTDQEDQLLGVISLGDITYALGTHEEEAVNVLVRDVMTTDVVTCSPDDDLEDVLKRIADKGIRHVPVVNRDKLAGLVVRRDALEFLYQQASLDVAHLTDWLFRSDARY